MGFGSLIGKAIGFGMKNAPKIGKAFGSIAEGSKKFGQIVEGGKKFGQVIDTASGGKLGQTRFYKNADKLTDKAQMITGQVRNNFNKAGAQFEKSFN